MFSVAELPEHMHISSTVFNQHLVCPGCGVQLGVFPFCSDLPRNFYLEVNTSRSGS